MLEGTDGSGAMVDTHDLLLSLAGLIDDELLGWSRELAAVGEPDHALELVTAAVAADRVGLPEHTHAALLAAADRRGRAEAELPAPEPASAMPHRFLADPAAAGFPAGVVDRFPPGALDAMPARLLRGCQLWLSWRVTPAGAAPGPVPHPVLLIEATDGSAADVLSYQVADLLWQAGVFASVEVFTADAELGDYHRAALEEAHAVGVEPAGGSRTDGPGVTGRDMTGVGPTGARMTGADAAGVAGLGGERGPWSPDGARVPDPASTPPRGTAAVRDAGPLQPVDRVIAARTSTSRGPSRGEVSGGPADAGRPLPSDELERQLRNDPFDRAAGSEPMDRPVDGDPPRETRPPRGGRGSPSRDQRTRPRDEPGAPPPGPARPGGSVFAKPDWPGNPPERPGPPATRPSERPGPAGERLGRTAERPGPVGGRVAPPERRGPGPDRAGPAKQAAGPPPKRPPARPADMPDPPAGLSDVEQRLLRQLHEELAVREDGGLPPADQPPSRIVRNANGGRRAGPPPSMGPPPDPTG